MSPWQMMLDDWCFKHADCNLTAWRTADYRDPRLVGEFIEFIEHAVPDWATHFFYEHVDAGGSVPWIKEISFKG